MTLNHIKNQPYVEAPVTQYSLKLLTQNAVQKTSYHIQNVLYLKNLF